MSTQKRDREASVEWMLKLLDGLVWPSLETLIRVAEPRLLVSNGKYIEFRHKIVGELPCRFSELGQLLVGNLRVYFLPVLGPI